MRALLLLLALWACAGGSGCVALAIGGGAVGAAYVLGDVDRTYPCDIEMVWHASQTALAELQLPPGYDSKDALKARIDRRTATGDRIRITLTSRGEVTKLNLRVNTFGNRSMSHAIVQRIESHLPVPPVPPGPPAYGAAPAGEWPVRTAEGGPELPRPLPAADAAQAPPE